ncbi:SH3KBP1-binding 1 [Paramuricea clavata]|uniref:SH3KBP1-binding 1 n=1 Tax=Paramuricea clavata TaxID=317549 RepID=A0A6S7LQH1_PARCT|nr:SH3KBP1-binding 1 [Paramuricea clavata]
MSTDDLLTKFDEMVKRFREEFNEIIEGERAKMKAEVEAYNAEKQKMKPFEVSDDDIIDLNVGGQKLTTTRSTLCQVEGSLLASMFSGRWEDGLKRDKDGAIFFDFDPQYFVIILAYLRARKIATPENPVPAPKVPEEQAKHFNDLVQYLGLNEEIVPKAEISPSEKFNLHGAGVALQEGGKVGCHNVSNASYDYVLGENVYQHGIVNLKLKLESLKNNQWMFIGILKGDDIPVSPTNNNSRGWSGSYGWVLGSNGGRVWENGSPTIDNTLKQLSKQGDTVELVLDCDAGKLSLHLPTGHQFHIVIPKSKSWRLNVTFFRENDKIRIVDG